MTCMCIDFIDRRDGFLHRCDRCRRLLLLDGCCGMEGALHLIRLLRSVADMAVAILVLIVCGVAMQASNKWRNRLDHQPVVPVVMAVRSSSLVPALLSSRSQNSRSCQDITSKSHPYVWALRMCRVSGK